MQQTNEQVQARRTTIYLSPDLYTQVCELAKKHRRSFNQQALWLMERGLGQQSGQSATSAVGAQS